MTVIYPEGVTAEGNVKLVFVPAIADLSAPKLTELNAAGAVDLSCYIQGNFSLGGEQATGTPPRRLCSKEDFQRLGRATRSVDPVVYVFDPQNPTGTDNKAYSTLKRGTKGFLVRRLGLDAQEEPFAVGDIVDVAPVECGIQIKDPAGGESDEFAVFTVTQSFGITGPVEDDAVLVA